MTDNRQDMQKMQRDAENRIREMQRKADRAISGADMPPVPNFVRVDNKQKPQTEQNHTQTSHNKSVLQQNKPHDSKQNKGLNLLKMFNFKNIKFDKVLLNLG